MILEDEIQAIHNKFEYVRNMGEQQRKQLEDKLAELTFDLNKLTAILKD
jgi:hypothetical protein